MLTCSQRSKTRPKHAARNGCRGVGCRRILDDDAFKQGEDVAPGMFVHCDPATGAVSVDKQRGTMQSGCCGGWESRRRPGAPLVILFFCNLVQGSAFYLEN